MINKRFAVLSIVMMFLFAAFTAGGCGGSSSSNSDNSTNTAPDTISTLPDMPDVLGSKEYDAVMAEVEAELRAEGIDPDAYEGPGVHYVMILSEDAVYLADELASASKAKKFGAAASGSISDIAPILSAYYESGDVIALYFPITRSINALYEALGERPVYHEIQEDDESTYPEIYAVAKRHGASAEHYFAYEVRGSMALLRERLTEALSNDEASSSGSYGGDYNVRGAASDDNAMRQEYLFQARRYANFIKWMMLLDKRAQGLDAGAVSAMSQFKAAANSSANFLDMSSQNFDGDAGYFEKKYQPLYAGGTAVGARNPNAPHPFFGSDEALNSNEYMFNGFPNRIDIHYDAGFSFTVYTAHNYSDGDDYYLFRSNAYTTPKNFQRIKAGNQSLYGNWGYTRMFGIKASVPGASTSEVILRDNAPQTVNRNGSVTDGITTTITGTFGQSQTLSGKLGFSGETPTGEVGGEMTQSYEQSNSVSYSHSQTWETKEWYLYNKSGGNSAEWAADFTSNNTYVQSATVQTKLASEWIWRVKNNFATKHNTLDVKVEVTTRQGFDKGAASTAQDELTCQRCDKEITTPKTICVSRPNQIFVGQKAFSSGKNGGEAMFTLLCGNNYTITSSQPSWCQVSEEQQSGSGTGTTPEEVWIWVEPYNESGALKTRTATITVTDTLTGDKMEIAVRQRNK